jgi:glycerophosphoryl diester phosphodiesterase
VTAAGVTSEVPFSIALRGGAADWPEMTAYAYEQAAALPGLHALDVAVCQSADGVLVCSYDPSTLRVTGKDRTIADEDWATLSRLTVKATQTSQPDQPRRPLARLEEILDAHLAQSVIVVEPRVSAAAGNLMALLLSMGQPERVIWKQPVTSTRFAEAKRHGFTTWGYVLDEPAHLGRNLTRYAASDTIDLLGTSRNRKDSFITRVVDVARQQQKQVIAWDVHDVADRTRLLELGCTGLASSHIKELMAHPVPARQLPPAAR